MPTTDMEFDGEAIAGGVARWVAMESPSYDLTGASLIKASITGANLEQTLFVNAGTDFCGAEISDDLPWKYKK